MRPVEISSASASRRLSSFRSSFQTTGNLVRSFYVATLDRPLTNNIPTFVEFQRDTQAVQEGVIRFGP
jgi:hypothetical protein